MTRPARFQKHPAIYWTALALSGIALIVLGVILAMAVVTTLTPR